MLTRLYVSVSRKLLNTTGYRKTIKYQFSGFTRNLINSSSKKDCVLDIYRLTKSNGISFIRCESTVNTTVVETVSNIDQHIPQTQEIANANSTVPVNNLISQIPDVPTPITEKIQEITEVIKYHANGEPTFESLGLGGYSPFGLLRSFYEFVHISCDLPWWLTIMLVAALAKLVVFPASVHSQRNSCRLQIFLPTIMKLQQQTAEATKCGNTHEASIHSSELRQLLSKNKVKLIPLSNFLKIGVHAPIFIALRSMANKPVESLQYGGFWWFTDLTLPDPYYILPLCTSITMYFLSTVVLQQSTGQNMSPLMKHFFKTIPVISFLFSMNFPGTVLCHWVVSNVLTIIENEVLKLKAVKMYFNFPINSPAIQTMNHKQMKTSKGFSETFFETLDGMKITSKLASYKNADRIQFNEAAKGPLKKTFKYNPVKNLPK